jgi:hypothetical protein
MSRSTPSSYVGELPNSHGRTLADESNVMQGILSGTLGFSEIKRWWPILKKGEIELSKGVPPSLLGSLGEALQVLA